MAESNVLFATSLAPIASLIERAGISHFKRRRNHIQIMESFSSRRRRAKRLLLNFARQNDFGFVQRTQVPGGTAYMQAWLGLAIVLDIAAKTAFKNTAKSHRGLGLRMPSS